VRMKPHYLRTDRLHRLWTTLMRIAKAGSADSPNSRLVLPQYRSRSESMRMSQIRKGAKEQPFCIIEIETTFGTI
jgi:hypothetical protein